MINFQQRWTEGEYFMFVNVLLKLNSYQVYHGYTYIRDSWFLFFLTFPATLYVFLHVFYI